MAAADILEEDIDYTWHPTEDEFSSPLTVDQWVELFRDESFAATDAAKAVVCLRDYGSPATFQQLSIRYRGTMGRYRRWLGEAARAAGERFGIPAPQQDQFGMDEWWPLLYQTRTAGKPGAGIFEMRLRPEVVEAYERIAEDELKAKRAENARQLQRIEQLERARQEERKRAAEQAAKAMREQEQREKLEALEQDVPPVTKAQESVGTPDEVQPSSAVPADAPLPPKAEQPQPVEHEDQVAREAAAEPAPATDVVGEGLPAVRAFLALVEDKGTRGDSKVVAATEPSVTLSLDVVAPVDYALRYAERMRYALALMRDAHPGIGAATLARALGDESVREFQDILNGQTIPSFSYLDNVRDRLFWNLDRLEVVDGHEETLPVFLSLHEVRGTSGVVEALLSDDDPVREIAYVVDDSSEGHRTAVVVRWERVRCALLWRKSVQGAARRDDSKWSDAIVRLVEELDGYARERGVARISCHVNAADWDRLMAGRMWPGRLLG